ncbi:hypothetical protein NDA16_004676 [Ustilago loliicola]|nr:hypothetical protein NDA16_004676 [Ustilago loliicola]
MYPELFQQMVCAVLESESYLFSNAELDILSAFFMLSYPARYLFVRLLQRKKDTWYRLDRLESYRSEVQDLKAATEELAKPISAPPSEGPKVETARVEEEHRRKLALDTDKENTTLTLPSLQRELKLDEETGLPRTPTYRHKQPLAESSIPANGALPRATKQQPQAPPQEPVLDRFVMTDRDMKGGIAESLSLLTIEELKVIAKNMGIAKIGNTRAQIVSALSATKSQSMLFRSPTKQDRSPNAKQQQLTLNFGPTKTGPQAQASRLKDELSAALGGGCIQVLPALRSLVDRVALVYYRGNLLGSAALTTAILLTPDRFPQVKKEEDLSDISLDEILAPAPDPTTLSLISGSGSDSPTSTSISTPRRSMRTIWRGLDNQPCHVEQLCLQHYALQNFKGYHCEGKLLTMLFVLLLWDVVFADGIAGSFETPYQSAPLDLGSDSFPIVRSTEIRTRLDHIERTGGLDLIAEVDDRERPNKTWAVGCRWDLFSKQDLLEVADSRLISLCFVLVLPCYS